MKKQNKYISIMPQWTKLFSVAVLFVLASCKKDSDVFIPETGQHDTAWIATVSNTSPVSLLKSALKPSLTTKTFVLNGFTLDPAQINLGNNMTLTVPQQSLVFEGTNTRASGTITVDYIVNQNRGGQIRNLSYSDSDGDLYDIGVQFFISFKLNGQALQIDPTKNIKLNFQASNSLLNDFHFFAGIQNQSNGNIAWIDYTGPDNFINYYQVSTTNYQITTNKTGWIQAAEIEEHHNSSSEKTIAINLGNSIYTNANTEVFFLFNNSTSVMAAEPDISSKTYNIRFPSGSTLRGSIIVISRMGNDYFWAKKDAIAINTSTTNQTINYTFTDLITIKPLQQIIQNLDSI